MSDAHPPPPTTPAPRHLMQALYAAVFLAALDTAVVAPALPALRETFGIDHRQAGLLMVVFVLCSLCSNAVLAHLGDRIGRRPVFLFSVSCFALGSLLVALSPGLWMLLLGRAVQGIGAGGILPTASALVGDAVAAQDRGRALGLIGALYGMAFVVGPPLATLLMMAFGWPWIFLVNLPLAAVVLLLAARALPPPVRHAGLPPPDLAGSLLTMLTLAALVLGITRAADEALGLPLWPLLLLASAGAGALLLRVERRAAAPVLPWQLLRRRQLARTYLLCAGAGFGMGGIVFVSSIAQLAHGIAATHGGFVLLPLVLCSMVGSMAAGRALNRLGARKLLLAGFASMALGYAALAWTSTGLWFFLLATMPVGLGVGIVAGGALRAIAIEEAPQAQRGAAQGMVNLSTGVGTLLAAAAIGAVADFNGGAARGFAIAYLGVAALMLALLPVALGLHRRSGAPLGTEPAS